MLRVCSCSLKSQCSWITHITIIQEIKDEVRRGFPSSTIIADNPNVAAYRIYCWAALWWLCHSLTSRLSPLRTAWFISSRAVNMDSPKLHKHPTHFAADSLNFHKLPTCSVVVKVDSKILQASSYTLCGSENRLSELSQASNTVCSTQNGPSESLQASNPLCGSKTDFANFYRPPTHPSVVKTVSRNPYKHPTRFTVFRTVFLQ